MPAGDKVVVITGATRGIGFGLARAFLARGCRVVICGRTTEAVDRAVALLGPSDRVVGVAADVTSRPDLQRLWDAAAGAFGRVDVWINNAGISAPRLSLHEAPPESIREVIDTNLHGALNGSQVALNGFIAQGHGQLWNMEGFGSNGMTAPGMVAYGASKRAVTYATKALVKETKGTPVQVCLLSPGIVKTDLLARDYDGNPAEFEKAKKIFNILGDTVETVTPWLADRVLATDRAGAHVQWLTRGKALRRFATAGFRKRDLFAESATTGTAA